MLFYTSGSVRLEQVITYVQDIVIKYSFKE